MGAIANMALLQQHLTQLSSALSSSIPSELSSALVLSLADPALPTLRYELESAGNIKALVSSVVRDTPATVKEWREFLEAYLVFLRDARAEEGAAEVGRAFDLLERVYFTASTIFAARIPSATEALPDDFIIPTLKRLSTILVRLSFHADAVSPHHRPTSYHYASSAVKHLSRAFTLAATDRPGKTPALFSLANLLCELYFHTQRLRSMPTIVKGTHAFVHRLGEYPRSEQVMYNYWVGRYKLVQEWRIREAHRHLETAFTDCANFAWRNKRRILAPLLVTNLVLGLAPSPALLEAFNLTAPFAPLFAALRAANPLALKRALESDRACQFFCRLGVWSMLREKLEVVLWRGVVRKTVRLIHSPYDPSNPPTRPPTVPLQTLLTAFRIAYADPSFDLADVECICVSLLDQGYMKAYILHSSRTVVLQKGELMGFPRLRDVVGVDTIK